MFLHHAVQPARIDAVIACQLLRTRPKIRLSDFSQL